MKNVKKKIGLHALSGCNGCLQTFFHNTILFEDLVNRIDIIYAPLMKDENSNDRLDICILEGLVTNREDIESLEELREKSKVLISLGSCACFGNMPLTLKNELQKEKGRNHIHSLPSSHVKIDFAIPGCPPDQEEITEMLYNAINDKPLLRFKKPVCHYCTIKENSCLLLHGKECLGPIINGNCKAICPSIGAACTGCRGPAYDYNLDYILRIMRNMGISETLINERLQKYSPKEFIKETREVKS